MWCQDFSPHRHFAPWTFRPTVDISPHRQFAHRRFAQWAWGETSIDVSPRTRHFAPWALVRNVHRRFATSPWGETSMGELSIGRNVYCVVKRPWGEMSVGRKVYKPLVLLHYMRKYIEKHGNRIFSRRCCISPRPTGLTDLTMSSMLLTDLYVLANLLFMEQGRPLYFHPVVLSFFFSSPNLSQPSEIGCRPYFHTSCVFSANLGCRSETCCTRFAENTERKKIAKNSPSGHHRTTLSGYVFATKACIDNQKKSFRQQYLLQMS